MNGVLSTLKSQVDIKISHTYLDVNKRDKYIDIEPKYIRGMQN